MKILINTIKKIKKNLCTLEVILYQEYNNLLNLNINKEEMLELIKKKEVLFQKYFLLNNTRLSLEKKQCIFAPYKNNNQLYQYWCEIVKKSFFLKELNLKNKIIINKKIYLNQYFLELFPGYKTCITYNIKGNLRK